MEKSELNKSRVRKMTKVAMLSALATILMLPPLEMLLPFMPPFLKMDFSDLPALVGAFALGPVSGIIIELFKNLIHLTMTQSFGVGELANFVVGTVFVATAGYIYKFKRTKGRAILGMLFGTLAMTIASVIMNYFVMLPFYATLFGMSMNDIVAMTTKVNGLVNDVKTLIVFVFVPFNLFKGLVVSLITALFYKRISPLLHR